MGMARLLSVVLVLAAAPAFAQSVVSYELQLGGDNHADAVIAGSRPMYTSGSNADGQTFSKGVLNWAASVAVSGAHSQPGHPSDGKPTWGLANFVVSVELHQGSVSGPLVTDADFYSSIHDGGVTCATCKGGGGVCAGSAFALSFRRVVSDLWPGYARVTEAASSLNYSGPYMEVCMWPTVPAASGKILGTGAGYAQWCRNCGNGSKTTPGVGIAPGSVPPVGTTVFGLGFGPVIEGQIDTSNLAPGTYVLRLVPGTGTNVLRGDVDLWTGPTGSNPEVQAFAVAANQALEDTITFTITEADPCAGDTVAPTIVSAVSRKTHGAAGDFDIDIMSGNAVEGRLDGPTKLVVTFSEAVQAAIPASVTTSNGTVNNVAVDGATVTVDLVGVGNAKWVAIAFPGIQDTCGNAVAQTLCVQSLLADVTSDGAVNVLDLITVRNCQNQAIGASNFLMDVSADGGINVVDLITTRNSMNTVVTGTCP